MMAMAEMVCLYTVWDRRVAFDPDDVIISFFIKTIASTLPATMVATQAAREEKGDVCGLINTQWASGLN
jgi:hypothetical protein